MLPVVVVSDHGQKRIKAKHPWIFSNELVKKPDAAPGDPVQVHDHTGRIIATGYYNPQTLIAVRILSFNKPFDLEARLRKANDRRSSYADNIYRMVYGESDGLPGLIVDRYLDTLVMQLLTAGMDRMTEQIIQCLQTLIRPARILLRNDSPYRELEGLDLKTEWVEGCASGDDGFEMDGLRFSVDFETGQKTGFFLDQRENRKRLRQYGAADSLLDVFCYSGAWSCYGAAAGIRHITAVDSSADALEWTRKNAGNNGYSITTIAADGPEFLRSVAGGNERYDRIVLDPPAFCKSKRHLDAALRAYREINLRALKSLKPGGILFTCSCSQPVSTPVFLEILHQAVTASGRQFVLRELLFQPPDHPVLLSFPESHYLKCAILQEW